MRNTLHYAFVVLSAALFGLTVGARDAEAQIRFRSDVENKTKQGARVPPDKQLVEVGPLSDGRTLRLEIEYKLTGYGTQVDERKKKRSCVTFDRADAVIAAFAIDAAIVCREHAGCNRLPSYIKRLRAAKSIESMFLFEEHTPAIRPALTGWTGTKRYAQAWITSIHSYVATIQWHEIAHLALGHGRLSLDDRSARSDELEAEADGFSALFLRRYTGITTQAAALVAVPSLAHGRKERDLDRFGLCRVEALGADLVAWSKKYFPRDRAVRRRFGAVSGKLTRPFGIPIGSRFRSSIVIPNNPLEQCSKYARAFRKGVSTALRLISSRTRVNERRIRGKACS